MTKSSPFKILSDLPAQNYAQIEVNVRKARASDLN